QLEAAFAGQSYVQQDQIGLQLADGAEGLMGVFGFTTDHQIRLPVDGLEQPFPQDRMIINDENPLSRVTALCVPFNIHGLDDGSRRGQADGSRRQPWSLVWRPS